jgi:hypothetical protein
MLMTADADNDRSTADGNPPDPPAFTLYYRPRQGCPWPPVATALTRELAMAANKTGGRPRGTGT